MMKTKEQSAFPEPFVNDPNLSINHTKGMTLRDYFAAKVMQGKVSAWDAEMSKEHRKAILNDWLERNGDGNTITENIAIDSYYLADAMLKQREL